MPIKRTELTAALLDGTHVFPNNVVRQPTTRRVYWIGFHGTSSTHAGTIEREGLKAHKVLDATEIRTLCEVGRELMDTVVDPERFEWLLDEAARSANRTLAVNFFSVSALALEHTKTKGGQTKTNVLKPLVAEILNHRRFAQTHPRRPEVERIRQKLEAEADGEPVVYAVYLKRTGRIWRYALQSAIQTDGPIERWRIVAKLEGPNFADYDPEREEAGENESRRLAEQLGSQHFTATLPTEPPG